MALNALAIKDINWQPSYGQEMRRINSLRKLYEGNHSVLLKTADGQQISGLLFTPVDLNWLGNRLTDRIVDMVFPKLPSIKGNSTAENAVIGNIIKTLDLFNFCPATATVVSYSREANWKMYWSNVAKSPALRIWGTEPGEFTWWEYMPGDKKQPYAVQFWREEVVRKSKTETITFKVCERYCFEKYYLEGTEEENPEYTSPTNYIIKTTTAYKCEHDGEYKPVDLSIVFPNFNDDELDLLAYEEFPELTQLPGYKIENAGGNSDYTIGLQNLQVNLDKLAAQRQGVIDFCGFPHISVPERFIDQSTGMLDLRKTTMEIDYGDKAVPVSITNWDGNLSVSKDQWDLYDEEFFKLTIISPAIEGKEGANSSGTARRLGLYKTEVGITRRREQYNQAFEWAIRCAQELAQHMQGTEYAPLEDYGKPITNLSVDWPRPIPIDITDTMLFVQSALRESIMSEKTAISMIHEDDNWTEDQIQKELDDIEAKKAQERAQQLEDFSQIPGNF